jgi:anti-sigma factor RsiW
MNDIRMPIPGAGDPYAMWDAAYVLGSLSAAQRREFEEHMSACPGCRDAVADVSGMPALLSRLNRGDVAAMDHADPMPAQRELSPDVLPSLLATVRWRRRRTRAAGWLAAAAVVLGIAVFVGVRAYSPGPAQQVTAASQPMAQVGTTLLASTVQLSSQHWGTSISLDCVCLAPPTAHHDTLAMVVVGRDGRHTQLATWVAEPGHSATPAGSISAPVDQIAAVQVVAADSGQILLQRSL